ncbi:MAG: hypothetical protein KGY38_06830 [Desulfobacterales bacterium]|nr:hypothetical protein [Desulfobacterales bacterium]
MLETLVQTKTTIPPLRVQTLERLRLNRRLDECNNYKLTLVSAPAGFGKTTLLAGWASNADPRVAWLSVDREDNDPAAFWTYFVAALRSVYSDIGISAMKMLQSPSGIPVKAVIKTLINEIFEKKKSVIMVIDDFHLVEDQDTRDTFKFFIDYMPHDVHLIISTRRELPFSAGRLKVQGEFAQINAEELKFTESEAGLLAGQAMEGRLAEEEIAELARHCEGWAAGLQIAILAAQQDKTGQEPAFPRMRAHIIDYFMEEVFSFQPYHIQWFLLETSVLSRLNASLCNAVTRRNDSESILKHLLAANMFLVSLDTEACWYRYHHMFAEALYARLSRQQPGRLELLHSRASYWFKENRMPNEAIYHAIAAKDWNFAAELISKYSAIAIFRGDSATALRWMRALPEARIAGNPYLCISYAWALFLTNLSKFASMPFHTIEHYLGEAEKFYPDLLASEGPDGSMYRDLTAYVDALKFHLAYSRNEPRQKVIGLGKNNLQKFNEDNLFIRTNIFFTMALTYLDTGNLDACSTCLEGARSGAFVGGFCFHVILADSFRASLARMRGHLKSSELIVENGLESVEESFVKTNRLSSETLGFYDLHKAVFLFERNYLEQAENMLEKAMDSIRLLDETYSLLLGYELMFYIRLFRGADEEAVLSPLDEIENLYVYCNRARPLAGSLRIRYMVYRFAGDVKALQRAFVLAEEYGVRLWQANEPEYRQHPVPFESKIRITEKLNLIRLYLAEVRAVGGYRACMAPQELVKSIGDLLDEIRREDLGGYEIEALILLAMAKDVQGDGKEALNALKHAVSLAAPEGYLRVFVNEGMPIVSVLEKSIREGICTEYINRILRILKAEQFEAGSADISEGRAPDEEKPLSRQEKAVLRLIARGMSNQEIAEELCIAVTTVKTHNYNIFKKLNVSSRIAAVEKAKHRVDAFLS